jgi:uncharacterized membrane protein YjjP (DUF1212 family)
MVNEAGPEAAFVLTLGRALHTYGTPAHRLEDTLNRVCAHLGIEGQFFTQPTSIFAAFGPLERQRTFLIRVEPAEVQLDRLARVQEVVDQVLAGGTPLGEAEARLRAIEHCASPYPQWLVPFGFAVSGAASSRFLGGGAREVEAAAIVGLAIGAGALLAAPRPSVRRVFEPVAAVVATVIAGALIPLLGPFSVFIASLGGMIVLLPGLTLTTAMTEVASRHLAAGTARFSGAVVVFLSIGFGIALGGTIDQRIFKLPKVGTLGTLPLWTELLALVLAPLSLMVLLRAPKREAVWVTGTCILAFVGGRVGAELLGPELGLFLGSLTAGLVSNAYARGLRRPSAVTLVPALLMLVPGSVGFRSLALLLQRDVVIGVEQAFRMTLMLTALVAGLLVANVLLPETRSRGRAAHAGQP